MNNDRAFGLRHVFVLVATLATIWALAVILSGGFVVKLGSFRILSSRSARNPAIIAVLSGLAAWAWAEPPDLRILLGAQTFVRRLRQAVSTYVARAIRLAGRLPAQVASLTAAAASVAVVTVALTRGALVAGGADAYGYVSEAHFLATGTLRVEQPFVPDMNWPVAAETLTPLGYLPAGGGSIVPLYSPGLPLLMALFELAAGPASVFYVVPLLGGLAVWATYLMGRRLAGRTVGVSAALLLASSPTFLIQLMVPMSDVPVTAWWAVALALTLVESRPAALASGGAVGAAILTRPNLAPLALIPGALLLWRPLSERTLRRRDIQRGLLFAGGVIPACLAVAAINSRLYGSPLATGYGPLADLFSWRHLLPNLQRYPRWLLETQTAAVVLAPLALFIKINPDREGRPIVTAWCWFIAAIFACYFLYAPFETWFWLRFMLPAFPPLFVLTSAVLVALLARLARGRRVLATAAIMAALVWHGIAFGLDHAVFDFREGERKHVAIGEYVARALPDSGIYLSMQYSGSIRYYSGRLTVRYDLIPPNWLDSVIVDLRRLGYHPYIVLELSEEPQFRARFEGRSALAALDWPPVARMDHSSGVKIFDPSDRQSAPPRRLETVIIH